MNYGERNKKYVDAKVDVAQMQTETPPGKLLLIPPGSVQGSPLAWHRVNVIKHIDRVMFNEMRPHLPKYSQL